MIKSHLSLYFPSFPLPFYHPSSLGNCSKDRRLSANVINRSDERSRPPTTTCLMPHPSLTPCPPSTPWNGYSPRRPSLLSTGRRYSIYSSNPRLTVPEPDRRK